MKITYFLVPNFQLANISINAPKPRLKVMKPDP